MRKQRRSTAPRQDIYTTITDRILAALEAGRVPWQKPWDARQGSPRNLISGKAYRGVNLLLLANEGATPFWLTYRQASQLGGYVKKGERGELVVFWKFMAKASASEEGETEADESPRSSQYALAKAYAVFNARQCELPEEWTAKAEIQEPEQTAAQKITACDEIITTMQHRPALEHGGGRAFYRQSVDRVTMPKPETFINPEHYYSTLFHELTHATGHPSRLDRPTLTDAHRFGDTNYSKEELVAEMGAAFLCGVSGIDNHTGDSSAAYIQGWLSVLKDDKRLLIQAASQAQRAADLILGVDASAAE